MRLLGLWKKLVPMSTVSMLETMLEWGVLSTRADFVSIVMADKKFIVSRDEFILLMVLILIVQLQKKDIQVT